MQGRYLALSARRASLPEQQALAEDGPGIMQLFQGYPFQDYQEYIVVFPGEDERSLLGMSSPVGHVN
jgi:hypothetical protein